MKTNIGLIVAAIIEELQEVNETLCEVSICDLDPADYWSVIVAKHDYDHQYETRLTGENGIYYLSSCRWLLVDDDPPNDRQWERLMLHQSRQIARRVVESFMLLSRPPADD